MCDLNKVLSLKLLGHKPESNVRLQFGLGYDINGDYEGNATIPDAAHDFTSIILISRLIQYHYHSDNIRGP